jgi:hypothetical protein
MKTQLRPTDLTDSQGIIIQELIPPAKPGGRPRTLDLWQVVNAILHVVVGGIQWRMLPRKYPKGPAFIAISGIGSVTVSGNASMTRYVPRCANAQAAISIQRVVA